MESYKVNTNKHVVGILNLLKKKKNFTIHIEHDDAMMKNEATVEVPTDSNEEAVVIKANTNLWPVAFGCIFHKERDDDDGND